MSLVCEIPDRLSQILRNSVTREAGRLSAIESRSTPARKRLRRALGHGGTSFARLFGMADRLRKGYELIRPQMHRFGQGLLVDRTAEYGCQPF
jgi:hypothetical protein